MSMHGLFIVGTDTQVGKTYVTAGIARALRAAGRPVRVCKPVATGAEVIDGRLLAEDTRLLAAAAGDDNYEAITPWSFPEPVAPPVAARRHGVELTLDALEAAVRRRSDPGAMLLVEGVGGLLCPLTDRETVADLAIRLKMPLVVVTRRSLGTLNHTLLTLEAAAQRRLPVFGVVVNEVTPPDSLAEETNVAELRRRIKEPILAVVPHRPDAVDCPALAAVDWWAGGRDTRSKEG